jgi:hypothetical protein
VAQKFSIRKLIHITVVAYHIIPEALRNKDAPLLGLFSAYLWSSSSDMYIELQFGRHPVAVVQHTFTHKQHTEHMERNIHVHNNKKLSIHDNKKS